MPETAQVIALSPCSALCRTLTSSAFPPTGHLPRNSIPFDNRGVASPRSPISRSTRLIATAAFFALGVLFRVLMGPVSLGPLSGQLHSALENVEAWSAASAEAALRAFAEENNLKLGAVAQPLRAALTGRSTSPGIFEVLDVLGRQESLGRLGDQATT